MSKEEPDSVLVARAQRDRAAFAPLYDRYVVPIYRYCYRLLGNREAAEDATSETFTKAIVALPRYRERAGSASFRGWLYTIAYNAAMDTHRRRPTASLGPAWEGVDSDPLPDEHAESREASADLYRRIADLTPDQQAVLHLRLAGLTGAEIADALGRTPQAVKSIQFRAIQRLRRALAHYEGEEEHDARRTR
ncbi:MAG: sigma-70 family RNA polymerase sigma factor [Thermomicrobiales bacterium]